MRKFVLTVILVYSTLTVCSQTNGDGFEKNRWFFGGNVGLQFGDLTFVNISPVVGYKFTRKLVGGAGITYQYLGNKQISSNVWGGSLFGRYFFTDNIFVHLEYEMLSIEPIYESYSNNRIYYFKDKRTLVESYLAGGGYNQPISDRVSLYLMVLWDFKEDPLSPYSNPIIRGGIIIN